MFFLSHSSFFIIAFQLTRVPHLPNSRAPAAISVFEGELDIIRKTTTGKVTRDAGNFEIFFDTQNGEPPRWTVKLIGCEDSTNTERAAVVRSAIDAKSKQLTAALASEAASAKMGGDRPRSIQNSPSRISLDAHEGPRDADGASAIPSPARPQIYLQDDDVEFEDLDEDEPDDDLDL